MELVIILLALFGVKHFLADFVLQFPYMLSEKGIYGARGGIDHAGIHGLLTVIVVLIAFYDRAFSLEIAVICGGLDALAHYHIDWLKQQLSRNCTPADRRFWLLLGADQGLHYLTYVALIGLLT